MSDFVFRDADGSWLGGNTPDAEFVAAPSEAHRWSLSKSVPPDELLSHLAPLHPELAVEFISVGVDLSIWEVFDDFSEEEIQELEGEVQSYFTTSSSAIQLDIDVESWVKSSAEELSTE